VILEVISYPGIILGLLYRNKHSLHSQYLYILREGRVKETGEGEGEGEGERREDRENVIS
jgi:hypothetical protein